jgi:nucleoside phosphorylase
MKIGIIGAMAQEVAVLKENLADMQTWEKAGNILFRDICRS